MKPGQTFELARVNPTESALGRVFSYPTISPLIKLRDPQKESIECFYASDKKRKIISLPTGVGKSITGLTIAAQTNGRVLWIAHRDELIEQPADACRKLFNGLMFGIVKANQNDPGHRLTFASIQTLQKKKRLDWVIEAGPISLVIFDECHHVMAASSKKVLERLGCFRPDGPTLLGLTATIERSDKLSLADVFEEIVYRLPIADAIRDGYLVQPIPIQVPLPINPRALRRINDDFAKSDLERELTRTDAAKATAIAIKVNCEDRKTLVFCASVDQAKKTSDECKKLGLASAWVSGAPHMKNSERKQVIKDLASGKLRVVVCSDLLIEGYDEKTISAVVMAKPTLSQSRYIQQAGRGLRTASHKVDCKIIDLVFATDLGLATSDILLAKKEKKIQKKRKKRIVEDVNDEWKRIASYLRTAKIDLMEHGEIMFARASDSLYVTAAKDGDLVVLRRVAREGDEDDDRWIIEHQGLIYTPEPIPFQATLAACDLLMPSFGGSVAPNSPEWNAAAEKPVYGPGKEASEFTYATPIVQPASAPILMSAEDAVDMQQRIKHEIGERICREFTALVAVAIRDGKGHLYNYDKKPPANAEKWGWRTLKGVQGLVPVGGMLGWIRQDEVGIDPSLALELAKDSALRLQAREPDASLTELKKMFGTTRMLFKSQKLDWLKVRLETLVAPSYAKTSAAESK